MPYRSLGEQKEEIPMEPERFAYKAFIVFCITVVILAGTCAFHSVKTGQIERMYPVCRDQTFVLNSDQSGTCDQGATMTSRPENGHTVVTCTCARR